MSNLSILLVQRTDYNTYGPSNLPSIENVNIASLPNHSPVSRYVNYPLTYYSYLSHLRGIFKSGEYEFLGVEDARSGCAVIL
jgi:hypothetical protein